MVEELKTFRDKFEARLEDSLNARQVAVKLGFFKR